MKAKALKKKELQALQNKKLAEKQAQLAELEKEQKAEEALRKNPDVVNISETHTVYGKDYETNAISPKSFEIVSIPEHDVEPLNEYGEDGSYEELLDTEEALLTELPDDASDEQVDNLYAKTESLTRAKVLPFLNAVEQDVVDAEKRNTSLSESLAAATGFIEKNTEYVAEESLEEVPAPKAPNLESKEMSREEKKKEILNLLSQPKKPVETPEQLVAQKKKEILDLISSRSKT